MCQGLLELQVFPLPREEQGGFGEHSQQIRVRLIILFYQGLSSSPSSSRLPKDNKFPAHRLWDCMSYLGTSIRFIQLPCFGGKNVCGIRKEKQLN